jgi:hypothetical protein
MKEAADCGGLTSGAKMTDDQFRTVLKELNALRRTSIATGVGVGIIIGLMLGGWLSNLLSRLFP